MLLLVWDAPELGRVSRSKKSENTPGVHSKAFFEGIDGGTRQEISIYIGGSIRRSKAFVDHPSLCHSTDALAHSVASALTRSGLMMSRRKRSCCSNWSALRVGAGKARYLMYGGRLQYCK